MSEPPDLRQELAHRVLVHRRTFLGLLATGSGVAILGACSSDGDAGGDDPTEGDLSQDGPTTTTTMAEVPSAEGIESDPFRLGVASGDPLPSSVILWTRLAPDVFDADGLGGLGDRDFSVLWEVSPDQDFARIVASGVEPAAATFGHSVHADASGLDADTWYWYRFRIGDYVSPVGRTRTVPEPDASVDSFTFAFASCQLRTAGQWTAYDHLVADEPDLVLHLGDYIYEYPGGDGVTEVPLDAEPASLADYRVLYAAYKVDPKIQAAHAVAPWSVTWDDHEVENNYAATVAEKAEDQDAFADRRRAAYQAYWEHLPLRIDPPADDGSLDLYRTVRFGSLAEFFVLDGRQYRDDQVCGDTIGTSVDDCPEVDDPSRTMLGADQEAWLTEGLTGTDARWKVLAQQTVMKALVVGNIILNVDQWDGYPAARTRLLTAIDDASVDNVMVLTGDIHAGGAADIRMPDAGAEGPIVAHELVGPGISSPGLGAAGAAIDLTVPGLAYANFEDNGYVRCTVTPDRWEAEFVVVDTIAEPTATASVAATVEVTAGTPGIRRI